MRTVNNKYDLGFSAGALLSEHFQTVISSEADPMELSQGTAKIDHKILPVNSEKSQKRYLTEVINRLKGLPKFIIEQYSNLDSNEKRVIEFYATIKHYTILSEFMIEKVRDKWLNMDNELSPHDFKSFILQKLSESDDLDQVSELTISKLTQVALKMLKELGMFDGKSIKRVDISSRLLHSIKNADDEWFFDAMLLSDQEKQEFRI